MFVDGNIFARGGSYSGGMGVGLALHLKSYFISFHKRLVTIKHPNASTARKPAPNEYTLVPDPYTLNKPPEALTDRRRPLELGPAAIREDHFRQPLKIPRPGVTVKRDTHPQYTRQEKPERMQVFIAGDQTASGGI